MFVYAVLKFFVYVVLCMTFVCMTLTSFKRGHDSLVKITLHVTERIKPLLLVKLDNLRLILSASKNGNSINGTFMIRYDSFFISGL